MALTNQEARLLLLARKVLESCFPQQRRLVMSKSRRIAACCTRRAAKTMSVAARHLIRCLTKKNARCLYLNMFSANVQRDYYVNSVQKLLVDAGYTGPMPARLPFTFPNGSRLEGAGLDNRQDAYKKMRGSQWDEIDIDEVQSWDSDVEDMIESVLKPTIRERLGTIIVTGTPGDVHGGWWHRLAVGDIPGWETMGWSWEDNVYTRDNIRAELDAEIAADPEVVNTPAWRRENNGEWVIEDDLRVYHHGQHNLDVDHLPGDRDDYVWGLALDTGLNNDSAIVEMAYPIVGARRLYITYAWKRPGLDAIAFGEEISNRCALNNFGFKVVDPAAAQVIETIKNRWGLHLTSAKKTEKKHHIDIMNADLRKRDIKILPEAREALCGEYDKLVWDRRRLQLGEYVERAGLPNHCADAALYGHRECRHFWSELDREEQMSPEVKQALESFSRQQSSDEADYIRQLDERHRLLTGGPTEEGEWL